MATLVEGVSPSQPSTALSQSSCNKAHLQPCIRVMDLSHSQQSEDMGPKPVSENRQRSHCEPEYPGV